MEQKKICFLQYDLRGGGAERKVCTLANYFVRQGYRVEIGLFGKNKIAYSLTEQVKVIFIRRDSYEYRNDVEKFIYQCKTALQSLITGAAAVGGQRWKTKFRKHFDKSNDYLTPLRRFVFNRQDAVLITMMAQPYNEVMRIIRKEWASGKIKVPYIVMECNNPTPGLDATKDVDSERSKYFPLAARCVTMTQGVKEFFSDEIQKKCLVIPNPLRDDLPEPYAGERRKTVVTFCRLNQQKNLPLLIEAFAAFHEKHTEYTLEIYGEGELLEDLNSLIREKRIEDVAHIYPFDPKVHQKIMDCAMFVSSSDWEGFGNSILEALALALPVISTDCDFGPRDMIEDHVNGLLVPVGDTRALADAMTELAENPELARTLGRQALKVRETYAAEKIGRQWLDLIEEVKKESS